MFVSSLCKFLAAQLLQFMIYQLIKVGVDLTKHQKCVLISQSVSICEPVNSAFLKIKLFQLDTGCTYKLQINFR